MAGTVPKVSVYRDNLLGRSVVAFHHTETLSVAGDKGYYGYSKWLLGRTVFHRSELPCQVFIRAEGLSIQDLQILHSHFC